MIKINLLPKTINEKAAIRNLALALAVVLIAVVMGGFVYASNLHKEVVDMEAKAADAEQRKADVEKIQQEASTIRSSVAPIKQKVDFITAVLKYNEEYPALYEQVAKWTYSKVMLTSMACDGTHIQMSGRCKSLDDLGRYLLNMYTATDLFTSVALTSTLSGYPKGSQSGGGSGGGFGNPSGGMGGGGPLANLAGMGAISSSVVKSPGGNWIDFTIACMLKKPIAAPTYGAAAGAAGAAGAAAGAAAAAGGASNPSGMPAGPPM